MKLSLWWSIFCVKKYWKLCSKFSSRPWKLENFVNKQTDQFKLADNAELHENVEELAAVDDGLIQWAVVDDKTVWIRKSNSKESDFMAVTGKCNFLNKIASLKILFIFESFHKIEKIGQYKGGGSPKVTSLLKIVIMKTYF